MDRFDPVDSRESSMEINSHFGPMPPKDVPCVSGAEVPLIYMNPSMQSSATHPSQLSEAELQSQLVQLEKQYRLQEQVLSRQFEEQRRVLAQEQHSKMQDYVKPPPPPPPHAPSSSSSASSSPVADKSGVMFQPWSAWDQRLQMMMLQKQQQQLFEQQQQQQQHLEDQQRLTDERMSQQKIEKLHMIKHKCPGEESAVASNEVKAKLRECLLNKGHSGQLKNSPPEFRHWSRTQHSSLEQHSPPTSGLSPPLRGGHPLLGRYDDEYPLRKTASEPNLKIRSSKLLLRQKVAQRHSPMLGCHDLLLKKQSLATSEPNLKVRLALKQKMIERRSSPLLKRKDRLHLVAMKHKTTPLTIDTCTSSSNLDSDSGPNSPPSSSQGSGSGSGETSNTPQKEETAAPFPLQMMSKMMQSMPNISIGQPRDKGKGTDGSVAAGMSPTEAEMRARQGFGAMPLFPYYAMPMDGMDPTNPAFIEAQMKALELARSQMSLASPDAMPPLPAPPLPFIPHAAAAAAAMSEAAGLHRTRSEPLPLPGQLLLQQHLLQMQKSQQQELNSKHYLRQKLQCQLLQRSGSKGHMENVDEAAEARLVAEMKEIREREEADVVVVQDQEEQQRPPAVYQVSRDRQAFLRHMHQRAHSGEAAASAGGLPLKPLERAQSNPIIKVNYPRQATPPQVADPSRKHRTAIAYDGLMLKHQCQCQDNHLHPENPTRLQAIHQRLTDTGLIAQCEKVKCRKATAEELQTCHSEAYVHVFGSSPHKWDQQILDSFLTRFGKLPCGGIGVDSDTVWNEFYTPQAARMATGSVIELAFQVARGEVKNGFALVRPPGHHAEDTQAMGFCYFNSIAVATKLILDQLQLKRILILDWDVHHGNSTQQLFYTDPRVLYISLHRHDNGNFFPGTGAPDDCGIDRGLGFNVNIAFSGHLQPPMGDAEYLAAFRTLIMPVAREFNPELVLVSAGFDAAAGHPAPLGGYVVSPECFGVMTKQMMSLANGKVVLVMEGGYELKAIADSAEVCLRTLLADSSSESSVPPSPFTACVSPAELARAPCGEAVETYLTSYNAQEKFWPCLKKRGMNTFSLSMNEALKREKDEDPDSTVSAFASLSVLPGDQMNSEPQEEANGRQACNSHRSEENSQSSEEQPMEQGS